MRLHTDWSLVLPPISTKGKTAADVDALLQEARDSMLNALKEMWNDSHKAGDNSHQKSS